MKTTVNALAARWLSLDPLMDKFPDVAGYVSFIDNPILFVDPDGREVTVKDRYSEEESIKYIDETTKIPNLFTYESHSILFGLLGETKEKYLTLNQDVYKEAQTNGSINEDLAEIIIGINEAIESSNVIEIKITDNPTYFTEIPLPRLMTDSYGNDIVLKVQPYIEIDLTNQSEKFVVHPLVKKRSWLFMNQDESSSDSFAAIGGGLTEPCASCIFIHSLLDHGLDFVRNGPDMNDKNKTQIEKVNYQNKALKLKNSDNKIRNGEDHD